MLRISLQRFATMTSFASLSKSTSVHEGGVVASPLAEGERMKGEGLDLSSSRVGCLDATHHPIRWVGDPQACVDADLLVVRSGFVSATF
jgi:hypothetical protein